MAFSSEVDLTIIVPCYNDAPTVGRALDSILMQKTTFEFDIIVINDCSTDNSLAIIEKYAKKDNRIHVKNFKENKGIAEAFFTGLNLTSSKYVAVLDSDDYYTRKDKLEIQIKYLENDIREDYVAIAHCFIQEMGNGRVKPNNIRKKNDFTYLDYLDGVNEYCQTSSYIYRNIFNGKPPECLRSYMTGENARLSVWLM